MSSSGPSGTAGPGTSTTGLYRTRRVALVTAGGCGRPRSTTRWRPRTRSPSSGVRSGGCCGPAPRSLRPRSAASFAGTTTTSGRASPPATGTIRGPGGDRRRSRARRPGGAQGAGGAHPRRRSQEGGHPARHRDRPGHRAESGRGLPHRPTHRPRPGDLDGRPRGPPRPQVPGQGVRRLQGPLGDRPRLGDHHHRRGGARQRGRRRPAAGAARRVHPCGESRR